MECDYNVVWSEFCIGIKDTGRVCSVNFRMFMNISTLRRSASLCCLIARRKVSASEYTTVFTAASNNYGVKKVEV